MYTVAPPPDTVTHVHRAESFIEQTGKPSKLYSLNYTFLLLTINTDLQTFIEKNTQIEIKTKSSNSDTMYGCACRLKQQRFWHG